MFARAFALLFLAVAASVAASMYFGNEVLFALGLILTQTKLILKKISMVELPTILAWIKSQADVFLRVELLKKWLMTSVLPLLLGKAVLRRMAAFLDRYRAAVRRQYVKMLIWYKGLHPVEKVVAALVILCATVALSVTSLGLWLILFSVKLPLWIAAATAALWRMTWVSIQKTVFRALAFLQLRWLWRGFSKVLPARWLAWKRRVDYRIARAVIRRRRMTVRQLAERKDSLPFRLGLMVDFLTGGGRKKDPKE